MHCSSFSKTLAPATGSAGSAAATRRIMRNKLTTSLATAAPTQAAIAAYLEKGGFDRHLRQFRQQLALQQGEMLQAVARHFPKGTRATRPQGGYFIWVELPERIDTLQLHRAALGHGISIAPGPLFSATGGGNFLRLNYGHPWNGGLEQGMATLGKLMGARGGFPGVSAGQHTGAAHHVHARGASRRRPDRSRHRNGVSSARPSASCPAASLFPCRRNPGAACA